VLLTSEAPLLLLIDYYSNKNQVIKFVKPSSLPVQRLSASAIIEPKRSLSKLAKALLPIFSK
jgi:hypothetical protein